MQASRIENRKQKATDRVRPISDPFSRMAYQLVVVEQRRPLASVAKSLELSPRELRARLIGRAPFTPREINSLLRVIPDERLVHALLSDTPFAASRPPQLVEASEERGLAADTASAIENMAKAVSILQERSDTDPGGQRRIALNCLDRAQAVLERVLARLEAA